MTSNYASMMATNTNRR